MSGERSGVMPILNRLSRNLSPLEEDKSVSLSRKTASAADRASPVWPPAIADEEALSLVTDIGSLILTARSTSANGASNQSELALGVNGEDQSALTADIQALWTHTFSFSIEVRGKANEPATWLPTVLLEKWTMKIASKKQSSPVPPTSPKLLLQAVRSYLHFSQIRSWQEANTVDHAPSPFRLLYRVCDECDENKGSFRPHTPLLHTFPPLPLTHTSALFISLASLPRLPHLPPQLNSDLASVVNPASGPAPLSLDLAPLPKSSACKEGFPFSPPLPSPLSPKLLTGLADRATLLSMRSNESPLSMATLETTLKKLSVNPDPKPVPVRGHGGPVGPVAGSPAPFSRVHKERRGANRRSCAISCKPPLSRPLPQRSNSAPVNVPSLCLLGTFEESVLNGRLEALGQVEGFTVELGASGAFCPPHIILPVSTAFYSLHDNHGGTSPYLGQVDLSGVGKRGYHVPRKGTVQVTLFNPNHTVVKMYIVNYDFSDMPEHTQTFLRQKTLSRCCQPSQGMMALPALHYLIHLRFLCSKSGRVYLHGDIKLIFAQRAPDTEPEHSHSQLSLYTTTEGPLEPKYSPSL